MGLDPIRSRSDRHPNNLSHVSRLARGVSSDVFPPPMPALALLWPEKPGVRAVSGCPIDAQSHRVVHISRSVSRPQFDFRSSEFDCGLLATVEAAAVRCDLRLFAQPEHFIDLAIGRPIVSGGVAREMIQLAGGSSADAPLCALRRRARSWLPWLCGLLVSDSYSSMALSSSPSAS